MSIVDIFENRKRTYKVGRLALYFSGAMQTHVSRACLDLEPI
jgi:hypothetical protein